MSEGRSRIWVVARVHGPDEGGVQTYVAQVAQGYARAGREVTVFAKSSAGPRRVVDGSITLIDVGPASQLGVYARLVIAMARAWAGGERPDAVHACTWRAAIPALPFPRPLIVTVHGREVGRPAGVAFRLMSAVLSHTARIVAVSDATRVLTLSRLPALADRCVAAWNGVVVPPQRAETGNAVPRIITVCRLVARKNVAAAVRAVSNCRAGGIAIDYAVIGRGEDEPAVREAVADGAVLAEPGGIAMTGYVGDEELAQRYRTADIFLHPQIALEGGAEMEGFGLSVADAMVQGIPCIVGRDGGPAELVRDGVDGLVVDGRVPSEIRAAVALLARDPVYRRKLGENARAFAVQNFCWDRHCRLALEGVIPEAQGNAPPVQEAVTA
ncbi:glycosyl transferase family 1 [Novosphingobium barchaimii LL02]|uniref:Glycosyl transferase family 1 n=1 Tax=Novosphingobium barchaimii LL02 TaxID=1114963 RepID=A0A0J8AJA8_9SPHN|nr:glycosyltransferase family 4 protein [Novosphingobium barchaimii]KMS54795.1 glycosyl transferase family 1 [Novosphingobium barchaimii LL02]